MDNLEKIGKILSYSGGSSAAGLADRVIFSIEKRKLRGAKIRVAVYSGVSALSAIVLYAVFRAAGPIFYQSGTSQIFSLIFSDFQIVLSNFNYYLSSLAESLPVIQVASLMALGFLFLTFVSLVVNNLKRWGKIKKYELKHS